MNFCGVMESTNTQSAPITESCTQGANCGESQAPLTEACSQGADCSSNSMSFKSKFAAPPQSQQKIQEFQEAPSFLC
jgi:hypothetical protein